MKYMLKFTSLTSLLLALVSGAALFWVSQQVQQVEREQRQLTSAIAQEEESMRVLQAEWDYLNRPERLEELSARYLNMAPVSADTILQSISAIPEPEDVTLPPDERPLQISTSPSQTASGAVSPPSVQSLPPPVLGQNEKSRETGFNQVLGNLDDDVTTQNGDTP